MFKNLKSLFIIEEEERIQKKVPPKQSPKASNEKKPEKVSPTTPSAQTAGPGKVTPKFTDVLLKALEANNLDGFDYQEYKQSLASLKKMSMEEATMYKSAFAMAQTMKASPEQLIKTAQHYINVLEKEEQKFEQALVNQRNVQIGGKDKEIKLLNDTIKSKAAQIKKLTQEIEQHQKKVEKLKGEMNQAALKVETTKNNFIASFNSLVGQIKLDVENMKKYLK